MQRSTTRTISPGEIGAGQFVTILDERDPEMMRNPLTGVPLKVLAVDLPFVLIQVEGAADRFSIDTRQHILMEMRPEFAQAFSSQRPADTITQLVDANNRTTAALRETVLPTLQSLQVRVDQLESKPFWRRFL